MNNKLSKILKEYNEKLNTCKNLVQASNLYEKCIDEIEKYYDDKDIQTNDLKECEDNAFNLLNEYMINRNNTLINDSLGKNPMTSEFFNDSLGDTKVHWTDDKIAHRDYERLIYTANNYYNTGFSNDKIIGSSGPYRDSKQRDFYEAYIYLNEQKISLGKFESQDESDARMIEHYDYIKDLTFEQFVNLFGTDEQGLIEQERLRKEEQLALRTQRKEERQKEKEIENELDKQRKTTEGLEVFRKEYDIDGHNRYKVVVTEYIKNGEKYKVAKLTYNNAREVFESLKRNSNHSKYEDNENLADKVYQKLLNSYK